MHQQVQAAHQHAAVARRPAPTPRAGSATGGRPRRTPRRRRHTVATRSSVWPAAGMVETTTVADTGASCSGATSTSGAEGCRRRAATVSAARAGSRTSSRSAPAPRSARARPVEAAVAPPPRIVAVQPGSSGTDQRSRRAAAAPGMSVLSAAHAGLVEHQRVGRAGEGDRIGGRVGERGRLPLQRHGQRQPPPRGVEAGDERRQPARRHRVPRRRSTSSPSAAYAARCSTGDSECAIGVTEDGAPQRMSLLATVGLGLAVLLQLVLELEELVVVSVNLVSPVARLTVT